MNELISRASRKAKTNKHTIELNLCSLNDNLGIDEVKYGRVSYEQILEWCDVYICRYIIVKCILENETHDSAILYNKNEEMIINKIRHCTELRKLIPKPVACSTRCLFGTYEIISNSKLDIRAAFNIFCNIKLYGGMTKKHCYDLVSFFYLSKQSDNDKGLFNNMYKLKFERENTYIAFSKESKWRKEVYDLLYDTHSRRITKTSAYPENTLRIQLSKDIRSLRLIESYVIDNYTDKYLDIDPILWFFNTCTLDTFKLAIHSIVDSLEPKNDRVRSKNSRHHGREFVVNILGLAKKILTKYFLCKNDLHMLCVSTLLAGITDRRECAPPDSRRHFMPTEINKITDMSKLDSKNALIICILNEIGLRVSALAGMIVKNVVTPDKKIRKEAKVLEKGNKYRTFPISENLENTFNDYFQDYPLIILEQDNWIFPSKKNSTNHISNSSIRRIIRNLSKESEIIGTHTHPHAFRHTLVNNLMANGNKIENVSKYMGHNSVSTTEQYYWTSSLENIIPLMNIPWLDIGRKNISYPSDINEDCDEDCDEDRGYNNLEKESLASFGALSTDVLINILLTYHNILSDDQKLEIKNKIPNIEEIFNIICDYSVNSSKCKTEILSEEDNISNVDLNE